MHRRVIHVFQPTATTVVALSTTLLATAVTPSVPITTDVTRLVRVGMAIVPADASGKLVLQAVGLALLYQDGAGALIDRQSLPVQYPNLPYTLPTLSAAVRLAATSPLGEMETSLNTDIGIAMPVNLAAEVTVVVQNTDAGAAHNFGLNVGAMFERFAHLVAANEQSKIG